VVLHRSALTNLFTGSRSEQSFGISFDSHVQTTRIVTQQPARNNTEFQNQVVFEGSELAI
jgi:hypothetical protein